VKNINLGQLRFDSRFNNLDKLITDITNAEIIDIASDQAPKNIYKVANTIGMDVHAVWLNKYGGQYVPSSKDIWFNHYKLLHRKFKYVNNIHVNIKTKLNKDLFIPFPSRIHLFI